MGTILPNKSSSPVGQTVAVSACSFNSIVPQTVNMKCMFEETAFSFRCPYCWNYENTQQWWQSLSHFLPCNSCYSSYICTLSWQQASLIIDRRVTKIERNLHHCAPLYSEQRTNWSIVNPLPAINSGGGNESSVARNDLQRSQRSAGIPRLWRRGKRTNRKRGWGGGEASGMICVRLGFAKVTPGRPETITAPSLVPSVCLPACCHTCRYLSLSLNGFPGFLMTAQPLFMSQGPITKTVNAGSKAQFTLH